MQGVQTTGGSPSFFEERRPSVQLVQRLHWWSLVVVVIGFLLLPTSWASVALLGSLLLLFLWWLRVTRFTIRLENQVLHLRLAPFSATKIPLHQIRAAATHMSYPWGIGKRGWSIRRSPGVTVFFTDRGAGLVLELEHGQAVWFNAQQADLLAALLRPRSKTRKKALP